jgi:hypothetical protein
VQLTQKGKSHYLELIDNQRTKKIAVLGAVVGVLALLLSLLNVIQDYFKN